jgi:hypothetical protein
MNPVEFLQAFSELSIALIGFSGIVLAVQRITDNRNPFKDIAMGMLVGFGSVCLLGSLIPQVLLAASLDQELTWRIMSALTLVAGIAGAVIRTRQSQEVGKDFSKEIGWSFRLLMPLVGIVALANLYFAEFWIYMLILICYLLVGVLLFSKLIQFGRTDV